MGIFKEVGKLLAEETAPPKTESVHEVVPFEDGEVLLEDEDILPVVTIHKIVTPAPPPKKEAPPVKNSLAGYEEEPKAEEPEPEEIHAPVPAPDKASALIDGCITGNIETKGDLTVKGEIYGDVKAFRILLNGTIHGNLECQWLVLQSRESKIDGTVTAKHLTMMF